MLKTIPAIKCFATFHRVLQSQSEWGGYIRGVRARAIWAAIESGDRETIELLFSRGAGVNEKNKDGDTPLQWATWRGRPDLVSLLISHGADY